MAQTTPQKNLGRDIAVELLDARLLPVYQVAGTTKRTVRGARGLTIRDFAVSEGRQNLGQALILRLLTPQGELGPLGHPRYGSRLHEVIGDRNTDTTRNLAKLHILASLADERRIDKTLSVAVTRHPVRRDLILIAVEVLPVGAETPLAISFALELETGGRT